MSGKNQTKNQEPRFNLLNGYVNGLKNGPKIEKERLEINNQMGPKIKNK